MDWDFENSFDEFKIFDALANLNSFLSVYDSDSNVNKRIVLITSGGTTVALESRTVRYLDNISSGTRGSVSAEWFLRHEYYVIFFHRKGSLMPFRRKIDSEKFLNKLSYDENSKKIYMSESHSEEFAKIIQEYQVFKTKILYLDFITIQEYLSKLQHICKGLAHLGNGVMLYLAAAVSDFYIPRENLSEHKIQSSDGPLHLKLQMVPKVLGPLTCNWIPKAFITSFKLETDPGVLEKKCQESLQKYKHQVVIGNITDTRKVKVCLATKQKDDFNFKVIHLHSDKNNEEIEELIVGDLVSLHTVFMNE